MKYKSLILFAAVAALLSCTKEEPAKKASVSLSESAVNFAYTAGGEQTVDVTSDGAWTVDGMTEGVGLWLSVEPLSGTGNGTVTVKCIEQNPQAYKRVAVFTFKTSDSEARLSVRQFTDPERTISSSEDTLFFDRTPGEEFTTDLVTNKAWEAEGYTEEVQKWLSIDKTEGTGNSTVKFKTVEMNETPVTRYVTIGFRINRVNCADVVVSQPSGIELGIDSTDLNFACRAGLEKKVKVSSNAKTKDWFIEGYTEEVQQWLDIDKTIGRGDAELTFRTKTQNDDAIRSAALTVKVDSIHYRTLAVRQASSIEIHLDADALEFADSVAQQKALKVTTSTTKYKWYVTGYTDEVKKWLKLSDTTFTGLEKDITVETLSGNRTVADRGATLRFCISETIFAELTVRQPMIPIGTKTLKWDADKSAAAIFAPAGASDYTAFPYGNSSSSSSWTKILDGKGGAVLFSAAKFTSAYEREYVFGKGDAAFTTLAGAPSGGYFCYPASYSYFRSKQAYFQTPAIPGYRLSYVKAVGQNSKKTTGSESAFVLISSDKGGKNVLEGGEKQEIYKATGTYPAKSPEFTLPSTETGTSYYMYVTADRLISSFTFTYVEVR